MGPNLTNAIDDPFLLLIVWLTNAVQWVHHEQRHCQDARYKHQTKVHVFSNKELHVTVPIFPSHYVGLCFDLVLDGFELKKKITFAWACNVHAFTGLLIPDFTMHQHHKPPITSAISPHVLGNLARNLYIHTLVQPPMIHYSLGTKLHTCINSIIALLLLLFICFRNTKRHNHMFLLTASVF